MTPPVLHDFLLDRMVRAVELVRERLARATAALEQTGVPYAVIGGNAVAAWVARVDEAAVRNTRDVDILLRRADLPAARAALEKTGLDLFVKPDAKARDAVHVVFAAERVRPEYALPAPDVAESESPTTFRVLNLDALLRMKLTSFRRKDQVHVLDMVGVGLIDASWLSRLPPELAARLKELLDTPEG